MKRTTSLLYYWRINTAVLLGAALTTAVLIGALLVGDSVRGSLRDLSLQRLGKIDHVILADRFFREDLAQDLSRSPVFVKNFEKAEPAIVLSGAAIHAKSRQRASRVNINGISPAFLAFFEQDTAQTEKIKTNLWGDGKRRADTVVINESLQKELGVKQGETIIISFAQASTIHRESLFGSADPEQALRTLRLKVGAVIRDENAGRFGLRPHQQAPFNLFITRERLQAALEVSGRANAVFIAGKPGETSVNALDSLRAALQSRITLDDLSFKLVSRQNHISLESSEFVLKQYLTDKVIALADELQLPRQRVLTYLANEITHKSRSIPWSTITAVDPHPNLGRLMSTAGQPIAPLKENEILINTWAAAKLRAETGDSIAVRYFHVAANGELQEKVAHFVIKNIVQLKGLGRDESLSPDFPGISNVENMADWEPTFPFDFERIQPDDEAYWDKYGAVPKAFVSAATGQRLWKSRFGHLTALRFGAGAESDLPQAAQLLEQKILGSIKPEETGFSFRALKTEGVRAAGGATDFGGLFIALSFFLEVAAVLLMGLLFRLGVEQRAQEIGIRLSVGFSIKKVRRLLLKEGLMLASAGGVLGVAGGVLYARAIMAGLRTWWIDAVGTSHLFVHVNWTTVLIGYFVSLAIIVFAISRTVRHLQKVPAAQLLAGSRTPKVSRHAKYAGVGAAGTGILSLLAMLATFFRGEGASVALFMVSGTLALTAGLMALNVVLKGQKNKVAGSLRLAGMSRRNIAVFPGRSILSVSLVACATYMIIAVGSFRQDESVDVREKSSGAGGYTMIAQSDVPLHINPGTADGRFDLGFAEKDEAVFKGTTIMSFRRRAGEDASCLNLYQPEKPTILGVPAAQIKRGGFEFQGVPAVEDSNKWAGLEQDLGGAAIPAFADVNSAMWILKKGIGDDVIVTNSLGQEVRLRLVGTFKKSIFQSELLISEDNFVTHFPNQGGHSFFLIDAPVHRSDSLSRLSEKKLADFGFDVTGTAEKLARFQAIENTYIAVFQTLGVLGLVLGTFGLGIVLFRNAIERKRELATLRAFGFQNRKIAALLFRENTVLLGWGLFLGILAAVISVFPYIVTQFDRLPLSSLAATLLVVIATGLCSGWFAVSLVTKLRVLPALKSE